MMAEKKTDAEVPRKKLIADLREFVRALDQRVPHMERAGEAKIAREAASLRDKALKRIAQLEKNT
jgi:hypothetical protein